MIADYAFYAGVYMGRMGQAEYLRLAPKAEAYLASVTRGRDWDRLGESETFLLQNAACAVADELLYTEKRGGAASESNDGVSVRYEAEKNRLYKAAKLYLFTTDLLYCGA